MNHETPVTRGANERMSLQDFNRGVIALFSDKRFINATPQQTRETLIGFLYNANGNKKFVDADPDSYKLVDILHALRSEYKGDDPTPEIILFSVVEKALNR